MTLARTPLHDRHVASGARLVGFGGFEMPVQYAGILAEHRSVRTAAGLFDCSHMGQIWIEGPGAGEAADWLCANDPRSLPPGRALYTPLVAAGGGTVDDALLYAIAPGRRYLLVVNAANIAADLAWVRAELAGPGRPRAAVTVTDASADTALLAVQGPRALDVLEAVGPPQTVAGIAALRGFGFAADLGVGPAICLVSRTGYTGEDGFELQCPADQAPALWDALVAAGAPLGLVPCGLGARDTLRLEAALPLYGHELSLEISPLEAGLGRFVRLAGRRFCGHEATAAMAAAGPPRGLFGLAPDPPALARAGAVVSAAEGPVGTVTSGTLGPTVGHGIALALCQSGALTVGARVTVDIRGRAVGASVVPLPFYRRRRG